MKLYGKVFYDTENKEWSGNGDGWWLGGTNNNKVRINFVSPFSLNESESFKISVSTVCGDAIFETKNKTTDCFDLLCISYKENELCGVAFVVSGEQSTYYYDDKNLKDKESVADVYAASLLLKYEAEYGFVSVMGSASIASKERLAEKQELLNAVNQDLSELKDNDEVELESNEFKRRMEQNKRRIERQTRLVDASQYYQSAYEFGKLWGAYCTGEQNENLNGRHVPLCTGGGPGIMEAAAKGAREQNAHVIGIDCVFGNDNFFDLTESVYLNSNMRLRMNNFAIREGILINYSHVILFWPGGFGTVWEVCETLSKLQTKHLRKRRIKAIFVHSDYWQPFFDMVAHMRETGTVNSYGDRIKIKGIDDDLPDDAYIAEVVETAEEAFRKTREFVENLAANGDLKLKQE